MFSLESLPGPQGLKGHITQVNEPGADIWPNLTRNVNPKTKSISCGDFHCKIVKNKIKLLAAYRLGYSPNLWRVF